MQAVERAMWGVSGRLARQVHGEFRDIHKSQPGETPYIQYFISAQ
jgi:hypothetical protein